MVAVNVWIRAEKLRRLGWTPSQLDEEDTVEVDRLIIVSNMIAGVKAGS